MAIIDEVKDSIPMGILNMIKELIVKSVEVVPGKMKEQFATLYSMFGEAEKKQWSDMINKWIDKDLIDDDTGGMLYSLRDETFPMGLITWIILKLQMYMNLIESNMEIVQLDRRYDLMSKTTPNPAPVSNLIQSMIIDPSRASENRKELKKYGYDDTQIDNIILSYYNTVPMELIRINYLRGNIGSDLMYERMRELGYTDTRIQEIIQTWTVLPGPQDLFTMVGHEAFEPDQYKALGLDQEFPADQVQWLEAQGISADWAMKYWISHWQQPSLTQGFDMLHRGAITRNELEMLFKVQEIPNFWREKLLKITYDPYTRVDIRRMHELGVLNAEDIVHAYQDIGYDAEKAVKMAEFTIKLNAEGTKTIANSTVLSSYADDLIERTQAKDLLKQHGMSDDVAEFYLVNKEYERDLKVVNMYIDILEDKYMYNLITESQASSELNKMGLRGSKIEAILEKWRVQKYKTEKKPTHTELDDLLIEGIIGESEWTNGMSELGYNFRYQGWFRKLIDRYVNISQKLPTKAEVISWYKKGLLDEQGFRNEMKLLGYASKYIDLYLATIIKT